MGKNTLFSKFKANSCFGGIIFASVSKNNKRAQTVVTILCFSLECFSLNCTQCNTKAYEIALDVGKISSVAEKKEELFCNPGQSMYGSFVCQQLVFRMSYGPSP